MVKRKRREIKEIMRIYYISDIHLELRKKIPKQIIKNFKMVKQTFKENEKNVIVLAGDIGNSFDDNYRKFLKKCRKYFDQVFVIHGNHEYYNNSGKNRDNKTMEEFEIQTQKVCDEENCNFLNKCTFLYEDVLFVGCTLWTKVDENAQVKLNDYRYIYTALPEISSACAFSDACVGKDEMEKVRKINHYDIYYEHLSDLSFIEDILKLYGLKIGDDSLKEKERKSGIKGVVVVTHHAPSYKMSCRSDILSKYYVNDLDYLFNFPLLGWISGHTHCSAQLKINGIPCVSNCYGYQTQTEVETNFKYGAHITIA